MEEIQICYDLLGIVRAVCITEGLNSTSELIDTAKVQLMNYYNYKLRQKEEGEIK